MKAIDSILTQQVTSGKTPAVQYVLFDAHQIIHTFKYGYSDLKNQKKVELSTTNNAYSVTKTFTALAILQLAAQNKLALSQSVSSWLPDFPYTPDITIQQLLTHSAGIPNPIPLNWIHLAEMHASFDSRQFFKKIFQEHKKTTAKPGEKFSYSNLGYVLLGQLIEKVSGLTYEDFIRINIINPLNIASAELDFTIPDIKRHARGYHKKWSLSNLLLGIFLNKSKYVDQTDGKWISFKNSYVNGAAYGGLIGSPQAFVKYIQELLKPDCKLLPAAYKKQLFTENYASEKPTGMCLSWFSGQLLGKPYFAHAGGGGGYYCELRIYPEAGIGSVIMFNRTGMSDERFLDKLDRYFINSPR